MPKDTQIYFLTVDWCRKGQRGIFCSSKGQPFRKQDRPHTEQEIQDILGPFYIILAPKSAPFAEDQLRQYINWKPLAEYTYQFGIALRDQDVPRPPIINPTN